MFFFWHTHVITYINVMKYLIIQKAILLCLYFVFFCRIYSYLIKTFHNTHLLLHPKVKELLQLRLSHYLIPNIASVRVDYRSWNRYFNTYIPNVSDWFTKHTKMKILSQCTYNPEIEAIEVRGELTGRDAIELREYMYACLDESKCKLTLSMWKKLMVLGLVFSSTLYIEVCRFVTKRPRDRY